MAEVIGLAASITAIAAAAGTACKIANTLYHLAEIIRAAAAEIEDFAMKMSLFGSIVEAAHSALEEHFKVFNSKVLQFMDDRQVVANLGKEAQKLVRRSKALMNKIRSIESNLDLWTRVQWLCRKPEVEALGPDMESVKTSLTIVMQTLTLETLRQQPPSPDISLKMWVSLYRLVVPCLLIYFLTANASNVKLMYR
jgi:hypothetical protein